jgi:molybdopterin-guanine dinucleotide biosynthesis protein A
MNSWFDQAEILILTPEETRKVTSSKHTFLNLNTPEDLQKAEKLALNLDPIL